MLVRNATPKASGSNTLRRAVLRSPNGCQGSQVQGRGSRNDLPFAIDQFLEVLDPAGRVCDDKAIVQPFSGGRWRRLRCCPKGQCAAGQLHRLIIRSSKWQWSRTKERHMPISQERELELEQELAAIVRKLERRPSVEKRGPKKPEAIQVPVGTILLDE